jgi:hypothetical protein
LVIKQVYIMMHGQKNIKRLTQEQNILSSLSSIPKIKYYYGTAITNYLKNRHIRWPKERELESCLFRCGT